MREEFLHFLRTLASRPSFKRDGEQFDLQSLFKAWEADVTTAVEFIYTSAVMDDALYDFAQQLVEHDALALPFPAIWMQWPVEWVSEIEGKRGVGNVALLIVDCGDVWSCIGLSKARNDAMFESAFLFSPSTGDLQVFTREADFIRLLGVDEEAAKKFASGASWSLVANLAALHCRDITRTIVKPSARIAAKRLARGQDPIPERHTITISSVHNGYATAETVSNKSSPRPHWRRGHVRRIYGDRLVSVAPCIVAGSIAGKKTYLVN